MIEKEYQTAFLIPSARDLLRFKKKLTVTGIKGNTQGVITANKPVAKQIRKMFHKELPELDSFVISVIEVAILLVMAIENFSSPLGKSVSVFANHAKLPLIDFLAVSETCIR